MALQDLQAQVQASLQDGVLALSDALLGAPFLNDLFHNATLNVREVSLEPADGALKLHGLADVLDVQGIGLDLTFTQPAEVLEIALEATFPTHVSPGIPGLALDNVVLRLNQTGAGAARQLLGALIGNTESGALALSIAVPPAASGDGWYFAARFEGALLAALAAWANAVAGDILGEALPLDDLFNVDHADIGASFDPRSKSLGSFVLSLAKPVWPVTGGFTVQDVQASLQVLNPSDRAGRAISTTLAGTCAAGAALIPVSISRSGATGDWELRLTPAEDMPGPSLAALASAFGGDLYSALPPELTGMANLSLGGLTVRFNPATRPAARVVSAFSCLVHSDWDVVPGKLALTGGYARLEVSYPGDAAARQVSAGIGGTLLLGGVPLQLAAQRDAAAGGAPWVFSGGLPPGSSANFANLIEAMAPGEMSLPVEVPDLTLTGLAFSVTPATGAFSFAGSCVQAWPLPFGVDGLVVGTTDVKVARAAAALDVAAAGAPAPVRGPLTASVRLSGSGPVPVVDGFAINSLDLAFAYDGTQGSQWGLAGALAVTILDHDYTLKAGLLQTLAETRFTFQEDIAPATRPLLDLGDLGSLSGSQFTIAVVRSRTPNDGSPQASSPPPLTGTEPVSLSAASTYSWSVTAAGKVNLLDALKFDGSLALHAGSQGVGLAFKPSANGSSFAEVAIPIPGVDAVATHLGFDYLDFARTTSGAGSASTWTFRAAAGLWFSGLPVEAARYLPASAKSRITGAFEAGSGRAAFTIKPLLPRQPFAIPAFSVGDTEIDLSQVKSAIEIGKLGVSWARGAVPALALEFALGLPQQLNEIFGTRAGKPVADVFVTYDEQSPDSLVHFRLATTASGDGEPGLELQAATSPFKKLVLTPVAPGSPDRQAALDFGQYGKFSFIMPAIGVAGQNFRARGGFTQQGLALPLSPLKWLLKSMGLAALNHWLPDRLPIEELPLYDAAQGRLNIDLFFDKLIRPALEAASAANLHPKDGPLPGEQELRQGLQVLSDAAHRLPDRMKRYLDIKLPEQFYFDLAASAQGGILGSVGVYPPGAAVPDKRTATPVRFMVPGFALTGPVLNGIELWNLSVGEVLGGALLLVKADVNLDQFDLLPLAAVLALPDDVAKLLPPTARMGKRLVVDHLVMLVVPEALVAVPIFFNQLGFEYAGLEGLELGAYFGFPQPTLDLKEALAVYQNFKAFFTTPDGLIDEGQLAGVVKNLDPAVRHKMDLLLTLGPLFLGLPGYLGGSTLGSRSDTYSVSLYGNLAHLLNAMKRLRVADLVQAIPPAYRSSPQPPAPRPSVALGPLTLAGDWLLDTPASGQGLLLHLAGHAGLADWASLDGRIDLVASDLSGFAGSFAVSGALSQILRLDASGSLVVAGKNQAAAARSGAAATPAALDPAAPADAAPPPAPVPVSRAILVGPPPLPALAAPPGLSGLGIQVRMPGPAWTPQSFTVEWWLYPTRLLDYNQSVSGSDVWGSFLFHTTATGAVYAGTDVNTRFTPADLPDGTVELGVWQHFAFTYDQGTARVYKNGRLLATKSGLTPPAPWTGLRLGLPYPNSQIDGAIADVRLWDHARLPETVRGDVWGRVSGDEPGLVACWPLDDGAGTSARDLAGRIPGTITGGAWAPSDRLRLAGLAFDTPGSTATMSGPQGTPRAFTIEWWLNPRSHVDYNQTVTAAQGWGAFVFHTTATGAVYVGTDVNTRFTPADLPDGTVELGVWQHFAFVYDRGAASFYKNGVLLAAKTGLSAPAPWTGPALGLDGACAELRVWLAARTGTDIRANLFRRLHGNEPGLGACWPLDDSAGTSLHDLTGHFPGTVQGGHWAQPQVPAVVAQSPVAISGDCKLTVLGTPIFTGSVRITNDHFWFRGRANLLPDNPIFQATAAVEGWLSAQELYLAGAAEVRVGTARLASGHVLITNQRAHLDAAWLGGTTALDISTTGGTLAVRGRATFRAGIHIDFNQQISRLTGKGQVKVANGLHFDAGAFGWLDSTIDNSGFSAAANASFTFQGHTNTLPVFSISTAPADVDDLGRQIKHQIEALDPGPYFEALFDTAKAWLEGIASGAIDWTRSAYNDTARTLQSFYGQTAGQATGLLKDAGYLATETTRVLEGVFTHGANEAAKYLAAAQYGASDATRAFVDVFNLGDKDAAAALKAGAYGYDAAVSALQGAFGITSPSTIVEDLKYGGYSAGETAQAMKDNFYSGWSEISRAMRRGGFGAADTATALRDQFAAGPDDIANALSTAGFGPNDIAGAMRALGQNIFDIAGTLWGLTNKDIDSVRKALEVAGFSGSDIAAALAHLLGF